MTWWQIGLIVVAVLSHLSFLADINWKLHRLIRENEQLRETVDAQARGGRRAA